MAKPLNIDNDRAERSIKPFVNGRKAWLFSQTAKGAKANGLVPYDYIVYLLEAFTHPAPDIEQLLPWNVKLGNGL